MRIKDWKAFAKYIKESKESTELDCWKIEEDDIRDYFQESIDAGYSIEVEYGFVGEVSTWNYKEQKTSTLERFTKRLMSGSNQPAISIVISHEGRPSEEDVSDNFKFAYSIISEEADAEIKILDRDGDIGDIDGIVAKGGLFFKDEWNENPEIMEAEGHIEFFVKLNSEVKVSQAQLAKYYDWCRYEEKDGNIYVDYSLEDLADLILARDSSYKDLLIDGSGIYDSYWGSEYQPDLASLFQYHLDKENERLAVKALIKETGGLEQFVGHIGDECDDMVYDAVKEMDEDQIIEYLLKERFYSTLKQMSRESEIIGDIKQLYGDWAANAHADADLEQIRGEFDEILDDNFSYIKGTREVEKKSKFSKDESGNWRTYKEEETFYLIAYSNDWIEDFGTEDLEGESLETIFSEYCYKADKTRYELKPHFSDYGDVDDKAWNKDVKSDLLRFLSK